MLDSRWFGQAAMLVPLILSLTVHEWAHAYSAYRLGDDTAKRQGRLTLDPLKHIDLIGTILVPLMGIPFGWAKPVPVDPQRFHPSVSIRGGLVLTSFAGPLSNIALALLTAILLGLLLRFHASVIYVGSASANLLQATLVINLGLAVFNLLPLPPLDGGRIVDGLMPARFEQYWQTFCRFSVFILLLIVIAPDVFHISVLGWPLRQIQRVAIWFISIVAGDPRLGVGLDAGMRVTDVMSTTSTMLAATTWQLLRRGRG